MSFTGSAGAQVASVVEQVAKLMERFPEAGDYQPAPIL